MTVATGPGRTGSGLLAGTGLIVVRNLRRVVRIRQLLVLATIQPIMFLLLFTYVFGGAIEMSIPPAAGGSYIDFLLPGLLVQIAVFGSTQTALGLSEDVSTGALDRFRSLPMARPAVLAGRAVADLVRNAFVLALTVVVGVAIGFRYHTSLARMALALVVVLVFAFSLSWVMAAVGLLVRNPEAVQTAVFICVFPFVFASAVFVPTATMPSWLQGFADNQPVTAIADAVRGLVLGGSVLSQGSTVAGAVVRALLWCAAITAVAAPVAVRLYSRPSR